MGFQKIHGTHIHHRSQHAKRDAACTSATFYKSPTMGQSVDSLQPLNISWDPTCMNSSAIDIYLYSSGAVNPRIHIWQAVSLAKGSYTANLMPRWWNSTASQKLQVIISEQGQPPFLSQFPGGPIITATYTQPASGAPPTADTTIVDSGITPVNDLSKSTQAHNRGKIAAGVLVPLLFIIIGVAVWFKFVRQKNIERRKEWSEKIDKRMSTISTDWKSVSAAGANAAIRHSMAVAPGMRNSSFSFGAIRPGSIASEFATDGGQAGIGARQKSQMRPGVGLRNPSALTGERVSRVSFAADTRTSRVSFANDPRPSGESRRTRAFHSAYIPPVPSIPAGIDTSNSDSNSDGHSDDHSSGSGTLSPTQTAGPLTLTAEDIRARIAGGRARAASNAVSESAKSANEDEMDEVMPALSMMRTGSMAEGDDFLFSPPAPPTPAHVHQMPSPMAVSPMSPVMSAMPMSDMAVPANMMSPDEMLRAYAERKKSGGAGRKSQLSFPMPVATPTSPIGGGGMRALFSPTGVVSPTSTGNGSANQQYPYQYQQYDNMGVGAYGGAQYAIGEEEDAYGGTVH